MYTYRGRDAGSSLFLHLSLSYLFISFFLCLFGSLCLFACLFFHSLMFISTHRMQNTSSSCLMYIWKANYTVWCVVLNFPLPYLVTPFLHSSVFSTDMTRLSLLISPHLSLIPSVFISHQPPISAFSPLSAAFIFLHGSILRPSISVSFPPVS